MSWRVLTYRLPNEGSGQRVAVWRELRRVGAVSLQSATWAIPSGEVFDDGLTKALRQVERAGGQALVLDIAVDSPALAELEHLYSLERDAEWAEFTDECAKAMAELAKEIATDKFTLAELEEEERSVDRLRRWYRDLRAKDLFGAAGTAEGERKLKETVELLEDFAERVYQARQHA